ncbi:peptidylprolyl isomerase [Membranihabitans marinus]|uniref:peptidylprolyl isomerase n=1 Tax=Membranihabitans marinus TaxID=1227546 RepID=UPI001F16B584|nr:peptidylprolyl isomerase [Membranihabitans marinus]
MFLKMFQQINKIGILILIFAISFSCKDDQDSYVRISTEYGDIDIQLYNETKEYKDNFLELTSSGFYNDLLFHRIIPNTIIQGGDPESKNAAKGKYLGQGGPDYTLKPDFRFVHIKGALAAARKPDDVNPLKESSGSQFYITLGQDVTDEMLNSVEEERNFKYSVEQRKLYKLVGGIPQLDHEYTVFGEVVSGLDVVEKIAKMRADANQRPVEDIPMQITIFNPHE